MSNDKRFVCSNEENREFSHPISEEEFHFILHPIRKLRFHYFDENSIVVYQDKNCEEKQIFLDIPFPENKEEYQRALIRMNSYFEKHIKKEVEKEIEMKRREIEKEIRNKIRNSTSGQRLLMPKT